MSNSYSIWFYCDCSPKKNDIIRSFKQVTQPMALGIMLGAKD